MFFQKIIDRIAREPLKLFLIDGYGALLSAFLYLSVLANFKSVFGMPQPELYFLGFLAGVYAVYSFSCYLIRVNSWQFYMKVIAIANLLHCCLTIGLVIYYYHKITTLGLIYFIGELMIVSSLAIWEFKTATDISN